MKKYVFFLLCTFWGYLGNAQIVNSLDSMRQQFEQDVARMRADFEAYEAQARADYERYVQSVKSVWGGDTIVDNTKKVWVEYGNDYRSRSIVDFEKGGIDVEIAVDESEKQDTSLIDARLVAAVRRMLDRRGSTCPYPSSVDVSVPLTDKPILDGLVDFSSFDMTASSEVSGVLPKIRTRSILYHSMRVDASLTQQKNAQQRLCVDSSHTFLTLYTSAPILSRRSGLVARATGV